MSAERPAMIRTNADGKCAVLAAEKGRLREAYALSGEVARLGGVLDRAADSSGQRRARVTVPAAVIRAVTPLGPDVGSLAGSGPDLREAARSSGGVTFSASSDKARRELGYAPHTLDDGLRTPLDAG